MKSVMISIQPKWCELIASCEKTLEVRKTRPKLATPFKCYIYCTAGTGKNTFNVPISHEQILKHYKETGSMECLNCPIGNQKVIGEFMCDTFVIDKTFGHDALFNGAACLSEVDAAAYSLESPMYGWHISNLKIYEKPKSLRDFFSWRKCNSCKKSGYESTACEYDEECKVPATLTRPPRSWCYVEEV